MSLEELKKEIFDVEVAARINKERPDWDAFEKRQLAKQAGKTAVTVSSYEEKDKVYTVILSTVTGKYTCNCRSYIFGNYNKKDPADFSQERTCKHIEDTVANKDKKLEVVLGLSGKYTVTVRRGQWEVKANEKADKVKGTEGGRVL